MNVNKRIEPSELVKLGKRWLLQWTWSQAGFFSVWTLFLAASFGWMYLRYEQERQVVLQQQRFIFAHPWKGAAR